MNFTSCGGAEGRSPHRPTETHHRHRAACAVTRPPPPARLRLSALCTVTPDRFVCVSFSQYSGAATFKTAHTCARGEVTSKSHKMPTLFSRFRACAPSRWSGRSHPAPASAPRRSGARRSSAQARRAAARSCHSSLGGHAVGKRLSGKWCGREPSAFGAFGRHQGRGPLRGPRPRSVLRPRGAQRAAVRKHQGRKGPQVAGAAGAKATSFWSVLRGRGLTSTECHAIVCSSSGCMAL